MTQNNTGGAAWMREQAAVAIGKFLMTKTDTDVENVCDAEEAIRAIPLPTNADLLADAMKLPEVQALVDAVETLRQEAWGYGSIYETAFHAHVHDTLRYALAPFTAVKETP